MLIPNLILLSDRFSATNSRIRMSLMGREDSFAGIGGATAPCSQDRSVSSGEWLEVKSLRPAKTDHMSLELRCRRTVVASVCIPTLQIAGPRSATGSRNDTVRAQDQQHGQVYPVRPASLPSPGVQAQARLMQSYR